MSDTEYMLRAHDIIYVDACSLMRYGRFERFLANNRSLLEATKKQIIIPHDAYLELQRLKDNYDPITRNTAYQALKMINRNLDLLLIDCEEATYGEIMNAFADREVLIRLINAMNRQSQLLITNDGGLSEDAILFNKLKSCRSRQITVCRVDKDGALMQNMVSEPTLFEATPEKQDSAMTSEDASEQMLGKNMIESYGPEVILEHERRLSTFFQTCRKAALPVAAFVVGFAAGGVAGFGLEMYRIRNVGATVHV